MDASESSFVCRLLTDSRLRRVLLVALFTCAAGLRLYRIQAPPLEFHPARQYMCAIIARDLYFQSRPNIPEWQRQTAHHAMLGEDNLEPRVMERLAAMLYSMSGDERLWLPRTLSVLFWLIGGAYVLGIARRLFGLGPDLVALAVYLLAPFGVLATRSFQPDPMMVMLFLAGFYHCVRHAETGARGHLVMTALFWAASTFVKPLCLWPIVTVFLGLWFTRRGLKELLTRADAYIVGTSIAIPVGYYAASTLGLFAGSELARQASMSITPSLLGHLAFWDGVCRMVARMIGLVPFTLALWSGLRLAGPGLPRNVMTAWWIGYALFCCTFTFHTSTHDYYHLQLLPLAALSLAPMGYALLTRPCAFLHLRWPVLMLLTVLPVLLCVGMTIPGLSSRSNSRAAFEVVSPAVGLDRKVFLGFYPAFRHVFAERRQNAERIGTLVGHTDGVIYLGEDGGTDLVYYAGFRGVRWPAAAPRLEVLAGRQPPPAAELLTQLTAKIDACYFVVTDLGDLAKQTELRACIESRFPLIHGSRDTGYLVFDLKRPVSGSSPSAAPMGNPTP